MRQSILDEVRDAEYFSIIVDETKDISKTEMISLILRYYSCQNGIQEAFLEYRPAVGLTADSLSKIILKFIQDCGLDLNNLVGQGYDGAAVMSGTASGVQKILHDKTPYGFYVHCSARRLNLCFKAVPEAEDFFAVMERLYCFLSTSVVHRLWIAKQKEIYSKEQPLELQQLSDTRWSCRVSIARLF